MQKLFSNLASKAFLRKPKHVCVAGHITDKLERNMSLFDLLCIGVGGTVGSMLSFRYLSILNNYFILSLRWCICFNWIDCKW